MNNVKRYTLSAILPAILRAILLATLLVMAGGCSRIPFERHVPQTLPELSCQQLLSDYWLTSGHQYLCRHSGLLEMFLRKIPLEGVMRIDTRRHEARLVAMDPMGIKLFDMTVDADGYQLHFLLPSLHEHPQLPQLVADSVRRIFLLPQPQCSGTLHREARRYRLRNSDAQAAQFCFVGMPARLQQYSVDADNQRWQVNFYEYQQRGALWVPGGAVLEDDRGYRLTLWFQEIRKL